MQTLMRSIILLLVLLCCSTHGFSEQAPDVTFTLKTTKVPAVYHLGERIVCKLSFSTRRPGKYSLIHFGEPRSEPFKQYQFFATPAEGAIDPHISFSQLGLITVGDSLSGDYRLSAAPVTFETDLNEWLQFTKPGRYRLHARSLQVYLYRPGNFIPQPTSNITVDSNSIDTTILPADEAWTSAELRKIDAVLDSPNGDNQLKIQTAVRLGYLNTAAAVSEMVEELSEPLDQAWHGYFYEGLLETSRRAQAISALKETIQNPRSCVSYDAVELLAKLTLISEYGNLPLPPYSTSNPAQRKAFQAALRQRYERFTALSAQYTSELSASVPQRIGRPRSDAIFALWKDAELHQSPKGPVPTTLSMLRQEIVSIAGALTPDQQYWLISIYWDRLPKEKLLPLVKEIAASPSPINISWMGDLRKQAQSRWCEVEPSNCEHG